MTVMQAEVLCRVVEFLMRGTGKHFCAVYSKAGEAGLRLLLDSQYASPALEIGFEVHHLAGHAFRIDTILAT